MGTYGKKRERSVDGAIRYAFSSEGYEYVIRCVFFVGGIICKASLCVAHYCTSAYPAGRPQMRDITAGRAT